MDKLVIAKTVLPLVSIGNGLVFLTIAYILTYNSRVLYMNRKWNHYGRNRHKAKKVINALFDSSIFIIIPNMLTKILSY